MKKSVENRLKEEKRKNERELIMSVENIYIYEGKRNVKWN